MTITYTYGAGLYLNITNRCTNSCTFCVRTQGEGIYGSDSLWLEREPTREEVVEAVQKQDLSKFQEIVFCGYGEPTCRLHDMLWIAMQIKKFSDLPIRVNTNGHSELLWGADTTPCYAGAIDVVSISLNTADAKSYQAICRSEFGEAAFEGLLSFARNVKNYVSRTRLSVVRGTISEADLETCKRIAKEAELHVTVFVSFLYPKPKEKEKSPKSKCHTQRIKKYVEKGHASAWDKILNPFIKQRNRDAAAIIASECKRRILSIEQDTRIEQRAQHKEFPHMSEHTHKRGGK